MQTIHPRIQRERETIQKMLRLYCLKNHRPGGPGLCPECGQLETYAFERLQRCPFQERKSTCAKCAVHCYRRDMRERVRQMMRYAGPRMLLYHPVLAVLHLLDGFRRPPVLKKN
jgi:hypothetical protein